MPTASVLRGFIAQAMVGQKAQRFSFCRSFGPGTHVFSTPEPGNYKFAMHGAGGACDTGGFSIGGASGAFVEKSVRLAAGQRIELQVGAARSGLATSLIIAGRTSAVAGAASGTAPGTAFGGDINLSGSTGGAGGSSFGSSGLGTGGGAGGAPGGGFAGGAGAPGTSEFPGGKGQDGSVAADTGTTPGAGQAQSLGSLGPGGDGRVIVLLASY